MTAPKWFAVAKNEYRIRTSSIRRIRPYFPFLAVGVLALYLFVIVTVADRFITDFLASVFSQVALASTEIILFLIFIYFIVIPITQTLREPQIGQLHILLSAPVQSEDILLGEFLGAVPLYLIFITVITGVFIALLTPLRLSVTQVGVVIFVFLLTFLSALWIGTVISALLRTKLGKTARGKDIGRALAVILALPLLATVYVLQFGGLETLVDPQAGGMAKTILSWLPSSWGARLVAAFASHPGNTAAVWTEVVQWFGSLVAFFVLTLIVGVKAAHRAYSLELTTFISSRAHPDGIFYKTVKFSGGGGSFGTVVVSLFKDYSRSLKICQPFSMYWVSSF